MAWKLYFDHTGTVLPPGWVTARDGIEIESLIRKHGGPSRVSFPANQHGKDLASYLVAADITYGNTIPDDFTYEVRPGGSSEMRAAIQRAIARYLQFRRKGRPS